MLSLFAFLSLLFLPLSLHSFCCRFYFCLFLCVLCTFTIGTPGRPALPSSGYGIGKEQLTAMTRDHDFSALQEYGGVSTLIGKNSKLNHFFSVVCFLMYNILPALRLKAYLIC